MLTSFSPIEEENFIKVSVFVKISLLLEEEKNKMLVFSIMWSHEFKHINSTRKSIQESIPNTQGASLTVLSIV